MEIRTASAACIGTYHVQAGLPCQDVTLCGKWQNGAAVVLADGAGSCPHALEGAESSAQTVLRLLEEYGASWLEGEDDPIAQILVDRCLESLRANPYEVEEQASTLLFALADNEGHYLCGHIGDGYIFRTGGEDSELLSDAENGEYLNETVFITSPNACRHLRLCRGTLQGGESMVLCSDGAGDALYERAEQLCAPAVVQIGGWLLTHDEDDVSAALEKNMNEVFRQVTADDMSVAILCAANAEVEDSEGEAPEEETAAADDQETVPEGAEVSDNENQTAENSVDQ